MKHFLLSVLVISFVIVANAQTNQDDYTTEVTWGVNKNTNSGLIGGLFFKIGRVQSEGLLKTIGFSMLNVKHPMENRIPGGTSTYFVYGKQNHLYSIRGQYGFEKLIAKKAPQQGVQISAVVAGGPSIGIVAPYYVLVGGKYQPYDPSQRLSPGSIQGSGKLFQGLGQSSIVPGLNLKGGFSFEFGSFKNNITGVEFGATVEAFAKKIIIIPTQKNRAIFTALYFNLYWGTRR